MISVGISLILAIYTTFSLGLNIPILFIVLKDDNKDRAVNMLNNNYRKINNYNYKNDKVSF